MKKYQVVISIAVIAVICFGIKFTPDKNFSAKKPSSKEADGASDMSAPVRLDGLLDAMMMEESGGNANAIGPYGEVGAFQIHKIYVDDVNRIYHRADCDWDWTYEHRRHRGSSRAIVKQYLRHYATAKRLGHEPTLEDMTRIHVAGPDGWRNDPNWFVRNRGYTLEKAERKIANAKTYWQKVKARLYNNQCGVSDGR